uniref:Uncharacterized protein n=1 Tax=Onchocerca volvulus TaxID=6282 RepID=A0A8R1TT75_ONCVO
MGKLFCPSLSTENLQEKKKEDSTIRIYLSLLFRYMFYSKIGEKVAEYMKYSIFFEEMLEVVNYGNDTVKPVIKNIITIQEFNCDYLLQL